LAETLSLLSPIEPRQNNLLAADPDRAHTSSNIGVHGGVDGITAFGLGDRSMVPSTLAVHARQGNAITCASAAKLTSNDEVVKSIMSFTINIPPMRRVVFCGGAFF
jgi:hypothetical protein